MKPFNLEEAKKGAPICTRSGKDARIICWDRKSKGEFTIVALINEGDSEYALSYNKQGIHPYRAENDWLMMKSTKQEGWINIYRVSALSGDSPNYTTGVIYNTKAVAVQNISSGSDYAGTIKIEWED